jgi:hypothetical protein
MRRSAFNHYLVFLDGFLVSRDRFALLLEHRWHIKEQFLDVTVGSLRRLLVTSNIYTLCAIKWLQFLAIKVE